VKCIAGDLEYRTATNARSILYRPNKNYHSMFLEPSVAVRTALHSEFRCQQQRVKSARREAFAGRKTLCLCAERQHHCDRTGTDREGKVRG
jgi:hypothetical protein